MKAKLVLQDGTVFKGQARGYNKSVAGEVVFTTGMTGYDLSLTDPSYTGQILTFTYPLIGNWGVPPREFWESEKIHPQAIVVSDLTEHPNHWQMTQTLEEWLIQNKVPAIVGIDTRALTQKLRDIGVMLGKIVTDDKDIDFVDPNQRNLVAEVSIVKPKIHHPTRHPELISRSKKIVEPISFTHDEQVFNDINSPNVALLNCGAKQNIIRCLTNRGATVYELPWNYDLFEYGWQSWKDSRQRADSVRLELINRENKSSTGGRETTDRTLDKIKIDGLVISNGPGNPKMATETINIIRKAIKAQIPTFGICLGNQLLALAAGGDTYKLKFGHRAQNQPTIQVTDPERSRRVGTKRCYITTQNHGFAVDEKKLPTGFKPWFINANDNTNEGIIHEKLPFFSVQFHPESFPGPTDTEWLFDYFLKKVKS